MTKLATRDCDCTHVLAMGAKRPEKCPCGNRFLTRSQLEPKERKPLRAVSEKKERELAAEGKRRPRSTLKRGQPRRDWTDARAKVEEEGCCRICKRSPASGRPIEAAHVLGREHDEPRIGTYGRPTQTLYVRPDRIFPACGPSPGGCHGEAERNEINVLPYLTLEEQVQAVKDAGGIEPARLRLEPVTRREEIEASAYSPTTGEMEVGG